MKSSYTKTTKTTSTYTKGDNKQKYQPKPITQTVKTIDTSKYVTKRTNPPTNLSKPASKPLAKPLAKPLTKPAAKPASKPISSYTRANQQKPPAQMGKINIDMSKYMSKRANTATNLAKRDEKPKWQVNKKEGEQKKYDRRNIGDTQTKVETMQDGEYLIKVTTTRKVVEKDNYDKRYGTADRRGAYGRK
jgi:hypothetical protein